MKAMPYKIKPVLNSDFHEVKDMEFTYGDDSRYIRYDGVDHPIKYDVSKGYVHAYVSINGKRIVAVDTERYLAFLNLQNHVYQELDLNK